jgi:hypothetical protein
MAKEGWSVRNQSVFYSWRNVPVAVPQGLKPLAFYGFIGTAKVVP